jgi:hypothetical protein
MNDNRRTIAVPAWFNLAAIAAVLWELLGAAIFWLRATADRAALPVDERAVIEAMPQWATIAFAVAVLSGLAGAVLLLLRRRPAGPLLLLSLVAVIVQDSAYLLDPRLSNLTASDDLFLPFLVILVCYLVWHLAWQARRWGWLR